jgi:hypothetical protein
MNGKLLGALALTAALAQPTLAREPTNTRLTANRHQTELSGNTPKI